MKEIIVLKRMYAEIRKWENMPGASPYKSMRLLKLFIGMGVDHFMSRDGKIHCQDFNRLAKFMGSHNPKKLIDSVVESGSFHYEKCDKANMNYYGIMWFSSTISDKPNKAQPMSDSAQLLSGTGQEVDSRDGLSHLFNKYIKDLSNIPSGGIACAHASDSSGVAPAVRKLLDNPDIRKKMLTAIVQVVEKCVERHGDKFRSTSEEGQEAWAANIIGSKHCANALAKKANEAIKSMESESFAPAKLEHPHGEFEYCYPGYPQRYFDYKGYANTIPADAPDRPSPTATWNKFLRQWREAGD